MFAIIQKSYKDFLSTKMLLLNILPVLLGLIFWGVVLYCFADNIITYIVQLLPSSWQSALLGEPESAQEYSSFAYKVFRWIAHIVVYVFLGFIVVMFALIGNIFVSIFYTPLICEYIRSKHYPEIPKRDGVSIKESIHTFLKSFVFFCAGFIVCVPFLFIPIIGSVVLLIPSFVFFYKMMFFDVGNETLGKDGYKQLTKQKGKIRIALLAYIIGLIPIFNFFALILQIIIFAHFCFLASLEHKNTKT